MVYSRKRFAVELFQFNKGSWDIQLSIEKYVLCAVFHIGRSATVIYVLVQTKVMANNIV